MVEPNPTVQRVDEARDHLARAHRLLRSPEADGGLATGEALAGLLTLAIAGFDADQRDATLARLHTEADDALGRVLALAEELDERPRYSMKPVGFPDLAARIRSAVEG